VAVLALSQRTKCCLHCCYLSERGALDEAPAILLDIDPLAPSSLFVEAGLTVMPKVKKMIINRRGKL